MLDRTSFGAETYRQTGDYCVLASYSIAAKPFLAGTGVDVSHFFEGYCREMGLCSSPALSRSLGEKLYLADFLVKTRSGVFSGYQVIEELHKLSDTPPFNAARQKLILQHHGLPQDLATVETALKGTSKSVAIIFVNQPIAIPINRTSAYLLQGHHSVVVGYDNTSFYIYDVNRGPGVIDMGPSAGILTSADCLLFTEK